MATELRETEQMRNIKITLLYIICVVTGLCDIYAGRLSADTINIENEAVRYVMTLSNSQFAAKPGRIPQQFYDEHRAFRPDQPEGKLITFFDATEREAHIWLSTDRKPDKADSIGLVRLRNGKGTVLFENLIPNKTYYYKIVSSRSRTLNEGAFVTEGQVRMIAIEGGFNIRDLGGWKGLGGRTVRYGMLYRGGSLGGTDKEGKRSDITPAGKAELHRLGIRALLDLRAKTDAGLYRGEWSLHSYSAGAAPLSDMDFNNTMTDFGAYNRDMSVISDVAWIIYELKNGRPVYFNCRQGADRTGTIAFLLEGLLGCYEYGNSAGGNQMALDYELTGFSQANLVDNVKVGTSCRPASEAYTDNRKLFRQLLDLKAAEPDIELTSLQQRCYYYLNRYVNNDWKDEALHIDCADLDWFIAHMLGMTQDSCRQFRPSWARQGADLKYVAEKCANVVHYAPSSSHVVVN